MAFKINVAMRDKTLKIESEKEDLVGKLIGERIPGNIVGDDLEGYELEITGHSDEAGFPGFKDLEGSAYHRKLLTYGPGMKNRQKGLRLRKTVRGEEISLKTAQINVKVIKEGSKKFQDLLPKIEGEDAPAEGSKTEEKPTEPEAQKEAPKEQAPKEEPKEEDKPTEPETPKEAPKEEKSKEETPKEKPTEETPKEEEKHSE